MIFHDPWVLVLIPFILFGAFLIKRRQRPSAFQFSSLDLVSGLGGSLRGFFASNIIYFRLAALLFILVALARPQSPVLDSKKRTEGIDIVLALDVSTSMLAEDFYVGKKSYSRLHAVKKIVPEFIEKRENDRLAVVVFGVRPYTLCPLTLNHSWILSSLKRIYAGMLEDRTAIGLAIASSLKRLENSKAKSKIIILLTDGRNNAGKITPIAAAEIARALNIKIYTIGTGSFGSVPYPIMDREGRITGYQSRKIDMDEDLLRDIASKRTNGKYFRATDMASLKKIYDDIDRMEKSPIKEKRYDEYNELFSRFLILGLLILLAEVILSNTLLRRIP